MDSECYILFFPSCGPALNSPLNNVPEVRINYCLSIKNLITSKWHSCQICAKKKENKTSIISLINHVTWGIPPLLDENILLLKCLICRNAI